MKYLFLNIFIVYVGVFTSMLFVREIFDNYILFFIAILGCFFGVASLFLWS